MSFAFECNPAMELTPLAQVTGVCCKFATVLINDVMWSHHSDMLGHLSLLTCIGGGLSSADAEVALWCSRLLCRFAAELSHKGVREPLWSWFSKGTHAGAGSMVDAWRHHPDLHAAGALMPLALHFSGDNLCEFAQTLLPRHLTAAAAYLSFLLELVPLLASSKGTRELTLQTGTLKHLVSAALNVSRRQTGPPGMRFCISSFVDGCGGAGWTPSLLPW